MAPGGRGAPPSWEVVVDSTAGSGTSGAILKALFLLVAFLVLSSVAYAAWVVAEYWDQVGV